MQNGTPQVELFGPDDARMAQAFAIRVRVFVDEQGVPAEEELDEFDRPGAHAVHALVRVGGRPVAAGRYVWSDERAVRIGRMAVSAEMRGRGLGRTLLEALIADARRRGFTRAHLHAQVHARAFYARAGFVDDGAQHYEAGILHQPMRTDLTGSSGPSLHYDAG